MLENKSLAKGFLFTGMIAIIAGLAVSLLFWKPYRTDVSPELDRAVGLSLFLREEISPSDTVIDGRPYTVVDVSGEETPLEGECLGEGHTILGYRETDRRHVTVYSLFSLKQYSFRDEKLVSVPYDENRPIVITLEKNSSGAYEYIASDEPVDGDEFVSSVKKLFPADIAENLLKDSPDISAVDSMNRQCEEYAAAYLKKIRREAEIRRFADENFPLLQNCGISEDVAETLCDLHPEYDCYLGSFEKIEKGVRYVYRLTWEDSGDDSGNGTVTFSKSRYDTGKTVEQFAYKVNGDEYKEIRTKKKK